MIQLKFFLMVMCTVAMVGCGDDEAPSATADNGGGASKAKYELEEKLRKFKANPIVYENAAVVAAQEATQVTQIEWVKARNAHPDVKPLADKANGLMAQATQEARNGDLEVAKKLAREAGTAKAAVEIAGLKVADLAPLNQARQEAQRAVEKAEYEAMKGIPEAKALVEEWEALGE